MIAYTIAASCILIFAVVRRSQVRQQVETGLVQNVAISLPPTASDLAAWARSASAQAELLAQVMNEDLAATHGGDGARYRAILEALNRDDDFSASWMMDTTGRVYAAFGDTTVRPMREGSGMKLVGGATAAVDFIAQAGRARVVLRTSLRSRSVPDLNPARPNNRTGRTTVFVRESDSIRVAISRSNDARTFPTSFALPTHVRSLDAAAAGRAEQGVAASFRGRDVAYAALPLPFPGWSVLREQEVDEVLTPVWGSLAIEVALVGSVLMLLTAFVTYWQRASRLRREHELTRIRADFVASVSHELRTPLAQIRMYAELLRKGSMRTAEDTRKALNVIEKESHRLNILVDNVLNFTRLRRQTSQTPSVPTVVDDDIGHVIEAFTPLANERAVRIERELERGLTAAVDSLALRQIVLNFLENAVKYGPVGQTVRVTARGVGPWTRIAVEDRGPGVPRDERDLVWEPFARGAAAVAANTTGSGIGLAVVRDLVLQNGGRFGIEDTDGDVGARFVVEFARYAGARDHTSRLYQRPNHEPSGRVEPQDNVSNRQRP